MLIEQAIFAFDQTSPHGWPMAAYSQGIDDIDRREIDRRGPAYTALWDGGADARSVEFFRLPSGRYCISQSCASVHGHKPDEGARVDTQFLVVDKETLGVFSNNALALLAAAVAQSHVRVLDRLPAKLEPFRLCGQAAAVDESALSRLASGHAVAWLQALIEAALSSPQVALLAPAHAQWLLPVLISCVPLECRLEFTFSTGLKYSPRFPFRIACLGGNLAEQRQLAERDGLAVVELTGNPPKELTAATGWSGLVANSIAAGKTSFLAEQLSIARPGLNLAALDPLGDELLKLMAAGASAPRSLAQQQAADTEDVVATTVAAADARRADAAHARFIRAAQVAAEAPLGDWQDDPAQVVGNACPAAIETLEMLDDLVFETIAGKPGALASLRQLWPDVLGQVGPALVEESREQYLRHAMRVWKECVEGEQIRNPALALAAMEVICLLFGDG